MKLNIWKRLLYGFILGTILVILAIGLNLLFPQWADISILACIVIYILCIGGMFVDTKDLNNFMKF